MPRPDFASALRTTVPRRLLASVAAVLAAGCSYSSSVTTASHETTLNIPVIRVWVTTPDRRQLLARQPDATFSQTPAATPDSDRITVDPSRRYQTMIGFGAAITDASALLIQTRVPAAERDTLLRELFGRGGIGMSFTRFTIGGSDFSPTHYTYDDVAPGARDDALAHFSIDRAREAVLPVLQRARAINPSLTVMASPWSAPAWMKTSGALITGSLRPDAYPAFAEYLRRTVEAFGAAGVPVALLSVQNEPHFEPKDYPGMRVMPADRAAFVGTHLGPLFTSRGVRTQILDWDHNWDDPQSPLTVLGDPVARRYIAGVAWHCYGGDVSAQSRVRDAYPDKDVYFTECAGGAWAPNFGDNLRWNAKTLMIGATRHWARGVAFWNLALDENHGPHLGGCNDCRGVITIDSKTGAVTRNEEYYVLAHLSRFVRPGAQRIESSNARDVETVAFRNPDDGSMVLLAVNSATVARTLAVRDTRRGFSVTIPAGAVATAVWY